MSREIKSDNPYEREKEHLKAMYQKITVPPQTLGRLLAVPETEKRKFYGGSAARLAAVCAMALFVLIPAGVFAAERISSYFSGRIVNDGYHTEVVIKPEAAEETEQTRQTEQKYVHVLADFGKEYTLKKAVQKTEDEKATYEYAHKDGFSAGKDFYYRLIRTDGEDLEKISFYDISVSKVESIHQHKAVYMAANTVNGTVYQSDHDTDYTQFLYLFFDEYGYIVEICGMQGLGEEGMVKLAEKITLQETEQDKADSFISLTKYDKYWLYQNQIPSSQRQEKILEPVVDMGEKVSYKSCYINCDFQVTEVSVFSDKKELDEQGFSSNMNMKRLFDDKGKLRTYRRETLRVGDGVKEPELRVIDTKTIQPKLVYVTMKIISHSKKDNFLNLPDLFFLEKKDGEYYDDSMEVNRPKYIEDAFMDHMPCYFQETEGGAGFRLVKLPKAGEEKTIHFAYLVDEDMTDRMYLSIGGNTSLDSRQYIHIYSE